MCFPWNTLWWFVVSPREVDLKQAVGAGSAGRSECTRSAERGEPHQGFTQQPNRLSHAMFWRKTHPSTVREKERSKPVKAVVSHSWSMLGRSGGGMGKCLIFQVLTRFKGVWASAGQAPIEKTSEYLLCNSGWWGRGIKLLCIYSCILYGVYNCTLSSLCEQGSISEPGLGLLSWWTNS